MAEVNIYVEGLSDKAFIEALLEIHFPDHSKSKIFDLEGNYTRLIRQANRLKEGKLNLIILDSDVNSDKLVSDILKPIEEEEEQAGRELKYECFFIERNLEDLARKICPIDKQDLWSCIDQYADCNSTLKDPDLRPVDNKLKVYIYVNAHTAPDLLKKKTFQNPKIWDWDSKELDPLINFLKRHLS